MFFTRSQQRAFMIVAVLSVASFAIRFAWQNQSYQYDFSEFHSRFLSRLDSIRQAEKKDSIKQAEQLKMQENRPSISVANINPNTADASSLQQLPGIGVKMAQRIIRYRQQYGPFRKPEDLLNIKGIGKKSLRKIRKHLKISDR